MALGIPAQIDKNAFDDFFRKYYPRLTAYAGLFLEPKAAEDLVQDVFVYLWENSATIAIHTSLDAYLFRAVYLRCLNQLKQRKNRAIHHSIIQQYTAEFEAQLFDPSANESIRKLFMEELNADIKAAIGALPDKCREVFMLSYIYNLKNKEISEVLGIGLSTVENHVYNALKSLRVKLAKHALVVSLLFPF